MESVACKSKDTDAHVGQIQCRNCHEPMVDFTRLADARDKDHQPVYLCTTKFDTVCTLCRDTIISGAPTHCPLCHGDLLKGAIVDRHQATHNLTVYINSTMGGEATLSTRKVDAVDSPTGHQRAARRTSSVLQSPLLQFDPVAIVPQQLQMRTPSDLSAIPCSYPGNLVHIHDHFGFRLARMFAHDEMGHEPWDRFEVVMTKQGLKIFFPEKHREMSMNDLLHLRNQMGSECQFTFVPNSHQRINKADYAGCALISRPEDIVTIFLLMGFAVEQISAFLQEAEKNGSDFLQSDALYRALLRFVGTCDFANNRLEEYLNAVRTAMQQGRYNLPLAPSASSETLKVEPVDLLRSRVLLWMQHNKVQVGVQSVGLQAKTFPFDSIVTFEPGDEDTLIMVQRAGVDSSQFELAAKSLGWTVNESSTDDAFPSSATDLPSIRHELKGAPQIQQFLSFLGIDEKDQGVILEHYSI